jgi:chromosome segregation ATPase
MEHRQAGKAGQPLDFQTYCREKLSTKDSLWRKLLLRKQSVATAQADAAHIESEITAARAGLSASQQKVAELKNDIATAEAELNDHTPEAIEESIQEAASIWGMKERTPHHASIVERALFHCAHAEASNRILSARLVQLKDKLTAEQARVESFTSELKRLEKSL